MIISWELYQSAFLGKVSDILSGSSDLREKEPMSISDVLILELRLY